MSELREPLKVFSGKFRRGCRQGCRLNWMVLAATLLLGMTWVVGARVVGEAVQAPSVIRGPYLQLGTPTGVVVRWRTDSATNSRVRFGASPTTLNQTVDAAAVTTEHIVSLTGLTPNTTYYYSVGTTAAALAGGDAEHFFITAPPVGSTQAVRFWVIGDAGWANAEQAAVRDAYYAFNGARRTDLWLTLGDNAYPNGLDAEFQTGFFDVYPRMLRQAVLWPALGNHDTADSTSPPPTLPYYQMFTLPQQAEAGGAASGTENYYSYNYANVHLVSLDAQVSSRAPGSQMLTWLQNDLAANHQDWLIVYWHHPPYSKGSHDSDGELNLIEMRANVVPILEAYGADLVLCGHSHAYERSFLLDGHYGFSNTFADSMKKNGGDGRPDGNGAYAKATRGAGAHEGAVYVVAGSSGTTSGGSLDHPAMFLSRNQLGSLVLDISGNRLDARFLRETGAVEDSFTILKGSTPNPPPSVNLHPVDQTICAGGNVTFNANAAGNPVPSAQWQVSVDDGASFNDLPGANNPNNPALTLSNVAPAMNGQRYRAVFTNPGGIAVTSAASLTVHFTAAIAAQPVSQTVCAGAPASFAVTPGGTGPFTFQWRKNNVELPGATGNTYALPAAAPADAGNYSVTVSGLCGSATSVAVSLTVNAAPGISAQPVGQTLCPGESTSFAVTATGAGPFTYQWRKNGGNLPNATADTLSLVNVTGGDAGLYDVIVTGACGNVASNGASLTVKTPVGLTAQPTGQTVCAGAPAAFSVTAGGSAPLTYQWRKNNVALPGANGSAYQIAAATANDAGVYDVVVTGACGGVTSQTATLTVNSAPVVTQHPTTQIACPNGGATFTAAAGGNPAPAVQWQVSTNNGATYLDVPGAQNSTLALGNVGSTQTGAFYRAVFTNSCGAAASAPALLNVPSFAIQPTAQSFTAGGGGGGVAVLIGAACSWTASSNAQWISITSGATGNGAAAVNYAVAANAGLSRTGTLTIAGQTFTVTQDSGCATITLLPASLPTATAGDAYNQALAAGGGAPAYEFTLLSGALPAGMTLAANGALSGQPAAAGVFNFAVKATDANGCSGARGYSLTVNTRPTISAASATQQQGSPAYTLVIANVADAEQSANTLTVTINGEPSAGGVTISSPSISAGGVVTAGVIAACDATTSSFTLTVTDAAGATATAMLTVTVTANSPPSLSYGNQSLLFGGSTTVAPTTPAGDNGAIVSIALQSSGGYTGGISVNPATGAISIGNAAPIGAHLIAIRATDNCGTTTNATLTLTVENTSPTIQAGDVFIRQQGSPAGSATTIAAVNDAETSAGNLEVAAVSVPTGINIASIANNNGVVTATISADCNSAVGDNAATLSVRDSNGGTATASIVIRVTANGTPALAYAAQSVAASGVLEVSPSTAPSDNGVIVSVAVQSVGSYAGTINVNPLTGAISIGNATPAGVHALTIRATDNCGATTDAQFALTVTCPTVTLAPTALPVARAGIPYNQMLTATGGTPNYGFTLEAGALPPGLALSGGGNLSGIPITAGEFAFTLRATDANGCFGARAYTLSVRDDGLMFYPLTGPLRLLDTRAGFNGCDAPGAQIQGNTSRTQLARRTCDGLTIPANARAVTGNITTVQSGGGYLTLYPSDAQQPLVANSNYAANEIINNVFTVGLGNADGSFKIFVTSPTDVVVDITGYYAPPAAGGLYFHPLPKPIRLLETRAGFSGAFTPGAKLAANADTPQQARVTYDGVTIPASALAIVGNATTLNGGTGYLTLYPGGVARPLAASSNFSAGQVMNAPFTVGLSATGEFMIFTTTSLDAVIDVLGYYSTEATDANGAGLLFTSLPAPVRLLETRAGFTGCYTPGAPLPAGSTRQQQARGACGGQTIADNALAIVGNATVVNNQAGYLTFWPNGTTQPLAASSNFAVGQVLNRHFTVGLGANGMFNIFASAQTDLIVDVSGFFAP